MGAVRRLLAMALAALLLAGCNRPEYWITGLVLPGGSHVIGKTETSSATNIAGINLSMGNRVKQVLMVTFNNSDRWDKVKIHFDRELKSKGYTLERADAAKVLGVSLNQVPDNQSSQSVRIYANTETHMVVTLHSMKEAAASIRGGAGDMDVRGLGIGDYVMRVVEMK